MPCSAPAIKIAFLFVAVITYSAVASTIMDQPLKYYKKPYIFTRDMVSHSIPAFEQFFGEFRNKPNIRYLEIGVFQGASLLWVTENILTHPGSQAIGIEIKRIGLLKSNLAISGLNSKIQIRYGSSQYLLRDLTPSSFEMIYVDGDHKMSSVLADAILAFAALKVGGIMIFDNYRDYDWLPISLRTSTGIDSFLTAFGSSIDLLDRADHRVVIRKKSFNCSLQFCQVIGKYFYDWQNHRVIDEHHAAVHFSKSEIRLIETYLKLQKFGEVKPSADHNLSHNPTFIAVLKKVGLCGDVNLCRHQKRAHSPRPPANHLARCS